MMAPSTLPYVLLVAVTVVIKDLGETTPMNRRFQNVGHHAAVPSLSRRSRETDTVEELLQHAVPCLSVPYLTSLKNRFNSWLDNNNDGKSTFKEVREYLRRIKPNISDKDVEAYIRRRDSNGNGVIDFIPDYVQDPSFSDYTLEGATESFHIQDTNDDGHVTVPELQAQGQALGMSPEEVRDILDYYVIADTDNDGRLTFDEFKTLYQQ